jgi:hypothetical protein
MDDMMIVGINCMRHFDRSVLNHLKEHSTEGRVHVIYREIADAFDCHPLTALNTVHKLRNAGHIVVIGGNNRTGFIYRINCD